MMAAFASKGCQSRHLARIFTVDIQQMRELNSLRRVSQLNVSEFEGAACRACLGASLRNKEISPRSYDEQSRFN
jgi:hypothetical protein